MKGFTLIELLAVIVILAIILLIAYPLISNVIDNIKRGAFESSVKILVKASENEFMKDSLNGSSITKNFQFEDKIQIGTDTLNFKGNIPKEGFINVRPDGKTEVALTDGIYCATKLYAEDVISFKKLADGEMCASTSEFVMSTCKFENSITHLSSIPSGYIGIYTAADLININTNLRANYILMNDIDLSSYLDWEPIGDTNNWIWFEGIFDGNGYSVNNMNIVSDYDYYQGLFAGSTVSHFKNLGLRNFKINGYAESSGGLVGYVDTTSTFENINVSGSLETGENFGGIVGDVDGSIMVYNSCADITVTGSINDSSEYFGGLIGHSNFNTYIFNSYVLIDFTEQADGGTAIGGLLGSSYQTNVIENSYVEGTFNGAGDTTGGLIGEVSHITLRNSYAKVDITNTEASYKWAAGGLIGFHYNFNGIVTNDLIENSYFTGNINFNDGEDLGGLIGYSEIININNSYAKGNISGSNDIGGLIGYVDENGTNTVETSLKKSFFEGNLQGADYVGGLVGYFNANSFVISDTYSKSNLVGVNNVGGFSGEINSDIELTNFYHYGTVSGSTNINAIAGLLTASAESTVFNNVYSNSELSGILTSQLGSIALNTTDFNTSSNFNNWDFDNDWMIDQGSLIFKNFNEETPWSPQGNSPIVTLKPLNYDLKSTQIFPNTCSTSGTGLLSTVPDGWIGIYTVDDFYNMRNDITNSYILMADINLEVFTSWKPIGSISHPFAGKLDGNGFSICNMNITSELASTYSGLFGWAEGAELKNISMYDFNMSVNVSYSGNLVGRADVTTFTNISYNGNNTYKGLNDFGIIAGIITNSSMNNINVQANIDSPGYGSDIGGIAGRTNGSTITNANVNGEIYLPRYNFVGGISGTTGTIVNSSVNADITGNQNVGGMIGLSFGGGISNSVFNGNVFGNDSSVGGLIGDTNGGNFTISNSHSTGIVEGISGVGGLCGEGYKLKVINSYSTANVIGTGSVGGLVGHGSSYVARYNSDTFKIENSYSTGNISGGSSVGGLLGSGLQGIYITKSYYKGNVNATTSNAGGLIGSSDNAGGFAYVTYVENSYADANITGASSIGGLFGTLTGKSGASHNSVNNYFKGTINSPGTKGGIIATQTFTIFTSSYWDTTTSGVLSSAGGIGRTTPEMQIQGNYTGWDFTNTWMMTGYPKLRWE